MMRHRIISLMGGLALMTMNGLALNSAYASELEEAESAMEKTAPLNKPYNDFLAQYVTAQEGINRVAYDKVTAADEAILETYINTLSELDISGFDEAEIMAYWFNLYNAKTIDVILEAYPLTSITKIGLRGPWKRKLLKVRGKKMSLDNIEHDIVRAGYDEPRVHFAFNCASIGCPNLKMTAWEAETLEADLTQAAIKYVSSPRGVTVTPDGKLIGSSLFKWYAKDFGETDIEVLRYLSQFATGDTKTRLETAEKFDSFDYDWDLNITN